MNPDTFELIELYLLGRLSDAEARAVEQRAATDADFAQELELQRAILQGVERFGDERLRAKIAAVDQSLEKKGFFKPGNAAPGAGRILFHPFHWAAAAAVLLLLGAGLWWAVQKPPAEEQPLAKTVTPQDNPSQQTQPAPYPTEAQAEPQPEPQRQPAMPSNSRYLALARETWTLPEFTEFRSTAPADSSALSEAWTAFEKKKYKRVIQLLEPLEPGDPNYWPASELYAHACFLSGQPAQAAKRFQLIAESEQLPFSERAEWYLLLCRLARLPSGKVEFDVLLNKILADVGHPYVEDARAITGQVQ